MRDLARPDAVKSAIIAALIGALASYPHIAALPRRPAPLWYLVALLIFGGFVLWAFVFAWHERYVRRPVFAAKPGLAPVLLVTGGGVALAVAAYFLVDPRLRAQSPQDYPTSVEQWITATLFSLTFTQLLLVFAPFDWSMRLFKHESVSRVFVILFGVFVLVVKLRSTPAPVSPELFALMVAVRVLSSLGSVWLYSRNGVLLAWWWSLLLNSRYLFALGHPL